MKKFYSVVAIFLIMLVLSISLGCAKPAAPAPPPVPPAPTATPKPTATATPTPTPTAKPVERQTFYIGTTSMTSSTYPIAVVLCKVVNAAIPELNLVPRECAGGTTENLNLLKTGELKIGFCPWEFADSVYSGTGFYKDQFHLPNLRAGWSWGINGVTVYVRKDSGVTDVTQLGGKAFGSSYAGSTSQYRNVALLEEGVGVKPNWFIDTDAVTQDAVKSGRIIGTTATSFPAQLVLNIAATVPLNILGLTQQQLDKANSLHPGLFMPILMPAGIYPGQDKPILTCTSNPAWFIDSSLSADLVYRITKAMAANPATIFEDAVAKSMRYSDYGLTWESALLKYAPVPLHAGLVRYFKEKGVTVPDKLIPPEAR